MVLVCVLPGIAVFGPLSGSLRLLAVIKPCQTSGMDGTEELTQYRAMLSSFVTDISNIKAIIGRVQTRGKWGMVDRTPGIAATVFQVGEVEEEDGY